MTLISLTADAHENSIKWSSYSVEDLKVVIANVDKINQACTVTELKLLGSPYEKQRKVFEP